MSDGDTDLDFVRLVPDGEAPTDDETFTSDFEGVEPLPGDEPHDPVSLDFVELYAANFNHFVRLAAIVDPEEPDELIDKAFLDVARRPDPPTTAGVALLEVRDSLVGLHRNRFLRPRRALVTLPDSADPVIEKLEELPEFQRDCLVLHHFAAMTPEEIADVWRTNADNVDDTLDFAEATFTATEGADARDVGDRIRRAITIALADFEGEPDVEGFAKQLNRRSRKPALIALAGVAAAAVLIIAIALWRASPAGEPFVGPSPADREVAGRTTTTKPTSTTKVPSVITLPGNRTTSSTPGTARRGTATTRRGTSGGGGGGGNNNGGGGGSNPDPATAPTQPPPTQPPPTQPPPTQPPPTTQPPAFNGGKTSCSAGGGQLTLGFAGHGTPGDTVTVSSNHGGATSFPVNADGTWSGTATFGGINIVYDVVSGTLTQSSGGTAGFSQEVLLGFACT